MFRAFWGAAPRTGCWAGMRARVLLASIMGGIIKMKVGFVTASGVLAHGLSGPVVWLRFGRSVGVSELTVPSIQELSHADQA